MLRNPIMETSTFYFYDFNSTFTWDEDDNNPCVKDKIASKFLPVFYSMLFIIGLVGNALVLYIVTQCVRLKSMTDVSFLNLAISDLLLVISLPFLAYYAADQWIFGDAMCKIIMGLYHVGFYGGIFFVTLMSIDRYLAVVHAVYAIRARTVFYGTIASSAVWVISVAVSFPEILYNKVIYDNITTCRPQYPPFKRKTLKIASMFKMNILGLLIPLAIMCFCSIMIIKRLLRCHSVKRETIKLVFFIVGAFFIFWTPYNIASFLDALQTFGIFNDCKSNKNIDLTLQVTEVIAHIHSCLNPYFYIFVGEKFKRHFIRMIAKVPFLKCSLLKPHLPSTVSSFYSQSTSVAENSVAL
ncbi:C-C chemokine receptor type 4-like [Polypterus senegalus]|uniref:C-C chemokine receptor type 4-like n=1 Tax=Polypterus senegalus TaxID=55291 RepID=UPI001966C8F4|nr:C-C chemokine receptor type 4-like [Polypterus senegalus]XP_039593190.1 C-C chemokine receptor type 4-like [Polypterus senegalus]